METQSTASEAAVIDTPVPVIDPAPETVHEHGSAGSVIAILLIVFLLVAGAFYVWGQRLSEQRAEHTIPATAQ